MQGSMRHWACMSNNCCNPERYLYTVNERKQNALYQKIHSKLLSGPMFKIYWYTNISLTYHTVSGSFAYHENPWFTR